MIEVGLDIHRTCGKAEKCLLPILFQTSRTLNQ